MKRSVEFLLLALLLVAPGLTRVGFADVDPSPSPSASPSDGPSAVATAQPSILDSILAMFHGSGSVVLPAPQPSTDPAAPQSSENVPPPPRRLLPDLSAVLKSKRIDFTQWGNPAINATLLDSDQVKRIFAEMAAEPQIPFHYPEDGCYARAEEMARILEAEGIATVKIFVEGDLHVDTPNSPKGFVEWWYHVAPAVLTVDQNGQYVVMVIDPSLFDHPVTKDEWVGIQIQQHPDQKPKVYFHSRYFYTPSSSDDADTQDGWLVQDLQDTEQTMQRYMRIQKLREKAKADAAAAAAAAAAKGGSDGDKSGTGANPDPGSATPGAETILD